MTEPEKLARKEIDLLLEKCGWQVQDKSAVNLQSQRGVAVRELSFKPGVILDYDRDGSLIFIEILDAAKRVTDTHKVDCQLAE